MKLKFFLIYLFIFNSVGVISQQGICPELSGNSCEREPFFKNAETYHCICQIKADLGAQVRLKEHPKNEWILQPVNYCSTADAFYPTHSQSCI